MLQFFVSQYHVCLLDSCSSVARLVGTDIFPTGHRVILLLVVLWVASGYLVCKREFPPPHCTFNSLSAGSFKTHRIASFVCVIQARPRHSVWLGRLKKVGLAQPSHVCLVELKSTHYHKKYHKIALTPDEQQAPPPVSPSPKSWLQL